MRVNSYEVQLPLLSVADIAIQRCCMSIVLMYRPNVHYRPVGVQNIRYV